MRNSKLFVAAVVSVTAIAGVDAASAADLAARPYTKAAPMMVDPAYDWSGFYIGANGGYGTSRKCLDATAVNGGLGLQPFAIPEGCHDATGGLAGGQVGYRWQSASWVFGIEAQGDWADLTGSGATPLFNNHTNLTKIDGLGLFSGQIGYAINNVLLYAKGGAAVAHDNYSSIDRLSAPYDAGSETRWGGVVGVGLEFGFTPNWSAAIEYDHVFMGTRNVAFYAVVPGFVGVPSRNDDIRQSIDMVTVRLNYKFGGPVVARY
jgi:outer membrane immunogenic protein